jgi:recombination protein RecR
MKYPLYFSNLIDAFKQLPGVGSRTAERFAFQLLDWSDDQLSSMTTSIEDFKNKLKSCSECGSLIDQAQCPFCHSDKRDRGLLCVAATSKDVFSIENTHEYYGLYHVLGGVISPSDGYNTANLSIDKLKERIQSLQIKEVVIALDSTVEGDATALHLRKELLPYELTISRLAFGLPMGSSLEYVDSGSLAQAMHGRHLF